MSCTLDLTGLVQIEAIRLKMDVKIKKDSGNVYHDHVANPTGTTVTFEQSFIDIRSITVTAKAGPGLVPYLAIYDFVDTPNPTEFKVLVFDLLTGAAVSGQVSWQAEGY